MNSFINISLEKAESIDRLDYFNNVKKSKFLRERKKTFWKTGKRVW